MREGDVQKPPQGKRNIKNISFFVNCIRFRMVVSHVVDEPLEVVFDRFRSL